MSIDKSQQLFQEAQKYIPGGVNSPVRAFKAVGGNPLFIQSAEGAYMTDVDGNRYLEFINSWGPMILGHGNKQVLEAVSKAAAQSLSFGAPTGMEVEMAKLITSMLPAMETVRMVNSGTEATMSAIRVARGYTGRDKIIKFEGCYHGHGDSFLIAAGSGAITMGEPDSPGVTKGTAKDTLLAPFNDLNAVKQLVTNNDEQIAAIILEPVAGNMGCVLPEEGFLQGLRSLCDQHGILLIFDEVMTGFRLAAGGAQELFDISPDLTTLGKIIGGGMPVGAYGGRKEVMNYVSPAGPVYQAGTLSGNPVAMAAGFAALRQLKDDPSIYNRLEEHTSIIVNGVKEILSSKGLPYTVNHVGSMFSVFFTDQQVIDFETAKSCDTKKFGQYFQQMLQNGVYLAPSQFETLFVSDAVKGAEIALFLEAFEKSIL